jgi:hypothetical protein
VQDGRARTGDRHAAGALDALPAAGGTRDPRLRPVLAADDLLWRLADEPGEAQALLRDASATSSCSSTAAPSIRRR